MKKQPNKLSLNERILTVLATKGTVTLADIRAALPDTKTSNISTTLWVLKKQGKIEHDIEYGLYALTDVNKPAEPATTETPAPKVEPKPKVAPAVSQKQLHIAQRDAKYWKGVAEERTALATRLNVQYEDALAIIRYLENKLYVVMQQGNKSGRNS